MNPIDALRRGNFRLATIATALTIALGFAALPTHATAQSTPIIYPSQGQSTQQQSQDEGECRNWAQQQSGFNPYQAAPTYSGGSSGNGEVLQGAGRGALLGLVGGAIGGDAGKGAAIGAGVGATVGLFRRRDNQQADSAAQQQATAQYNQGMANFNSAFGTCMQGRGYTVN
ncbi:MAG: glycine zipper family protein [Dongiaceae bacterium]